MNTISAVEKEAILEINHLRDQVSKREEDNEQIRNTYIKTVEDYETHIKESIEDLQNTNKELKCRKKLLEQEIEKEEGNIIKIKREIDGEKNTLDKLEKHLNSFKKLINGRK